MLISEVLGRKIKAERREPDALGDTSEGDEDDVRTLRLSRRARKPADAGRNPRTEVADPTRLTSNSSLRNGHQVGDPGSDSSQDPSRAPKLNGRSAPPSVLPRIRNDRFGSFASL